MVENWENILTNTQKEQLIKEGAKALEKLVSSLEVRDLIREIPISGKRDGSGHYQTIYLTVKGFLEESLLCGGHDYVDMADEHYTKYCKDYNKKRKIPKKEFTKIVEDYKLTKIIILEIIGKLKK